MLKRLRRHLGNSKTCQVLLACYWAALFVGTHLPRDMPLVPGNAVDKLIHVAAFATLAVLLCRTWQTANGNLRSSHFWVAWFALLLYGAFDEWTQPFVGRDASVRDWLADAIGSATGLAVFSAWQRRHAESADAALTGSFPERETPQ